MCKRQMAGYNQITSLIKASILNTTNREPVRSLGGAHAGSDTEVEEARFGAANRTAPILADAAAVERTTDGAVARHGQFER